MSWGYRSEPRNLDEDAIRRLARQEAINAIQSQSITGSMVPRSVPWQAVNLLLVTDFPLKPQDREEVNLLDEGTGYVSRWIYLNSQAAWREIRSQGDFPGQISYSAGAAVPPGWLLANGIAVSRVTYASLFAAIGTAHGAGDGSTTFTLPDVRDVFVAGAGTSALGFRGGASTATLATANLPVHTHTISSDGAHTHTFSYHIAGDTVSGAANGMYDPNASAPNTSYPTSSNGSHSHGGATGSAGSGTAFNILPPYIALTPIIRT